MSVLVFLRESFVGVDLSLSQHTTTTKNITARFLRINIYINREQEQQEQQQYAFTHIHIR